MQAPKLIPLPHHSPSQLPTPRHWRWRRYTRTQMQAPKLVALLPQPEELDTAGMQVRACVCMRVHTCVSLLPLQTGPRQRTRPAIAVGRAAFLVRSLMCASSRLHHSVMLLQHCVRAPRLPSQVMPEGFHLVPLPFADDLRAITAGPGQVGGLG